MSGPLKNARQERFAQELAKGKSQLEAYRLAGYEPDDGAAARLSGNVRVRERITELQERAAERAVVTQERVLKELARIGFSDMRKLLRWTGNLAKMDEEQAEETGEVSISVANLVQLFDSGEIDDDIAACISEISQTREGALKVKLYDKQQALVSLARHLGMFKDRVEHTGKDGGPIQFDQVKSDADAFESSIARLAAAGGAGSVLGETEH